MDYRKHIKYSLFAFLASFALVSTYSIASVEDVRAAGIMALLYNVFNGMQYSLSNQVGKITIYFAVIFYVLEKIHSKKTKKNIYIMTVFLAIMMTATKAYKDCGRLNTIFENNFQILKTFLNVFGYSVVISIFVKLLEIAFDSNYDIKRIVKSDKLSNIYCKHTFLCTWLIILIAWLPHIFIKYPGAMTSDNWGQLTQYNGMFPMYYHWPPFHTILLGLFVYTGAAIYSTNIGLFAYVVMQWIVMSAILAYTLVFLKECHTRKVYRLIVIIVYCTVPLYTGFVGVVEKDVLYSAFFVLYVMEIMKLLLNKLNGWRVLDTAMFLISATLVGLMRKNGIYIISATAVVFVIKAIISAIIDKKLKIGIIGLLFVIPIVVTSEVNTYLINKYDMRPGSTAEALSLPIQQTARYLSKYPDDLTDEEKNVINIVFGSCEEMVSNYDASLSDPVKYLYNDDITQEQLMDYLKVWMKMCLRHPLTCFEATFAQNYYIFDIECDNYNYYRDFHMYGDDRIEFFEISWLQGIQDVAIVFYQTIHKLPIIGLISDMAFNIILFLVIIALAIREQNWLTFFAGVPLVLQLFVIIAGPVIYTTTRYALPIFYSMPIFIGFYVYNRKNKGNILCKINP